MNDGIDIAALSFRSACTSGTCVEVAKVTIEVPGPDGSMVAATSYFVRDSKNPDGEPQVYDEQEWREFTAAVRAGEFD